MPKKKQTPTVREFQVPPGTLLQSFRAYVKEHPSTDDIISFLSEANARWLSKFALNDGLSEEEYEELLEFYWYFMANYGDKTEEARMENWGEEPLVIRMAENYLSVKQEDEWLERAKLYLANIPENGKIMREAAALSEMLFGIQKDREISCPEEDFCLFLQQTVYREDIADAHTLLLYYCAMVIKEQSLMAVRITTGKDTYDLFGIRGTAAMEWEPVTGDEILDLYCQQPDGTVIPPEEGVRYIGIDRLAGYTGNEEAAIPPEELTAKADIVQFPSGKK